MVSAVEASRAASFEQDGYTVIRDVLSSGEATSLRSAVQEQVRSNPYPSARSYPEPAKYTVAGNRMADPALAPTAEHPTVVAAVEELLGTRAHIAAFVAYLRTAGDAGGASHCDYRRWRPVGSSMNWLFAVLPLQPFDEQYGPLLVSPGSHRLMQEVDPSAHVRDLTPPDEDQLPEYVDAELDTGDLLLMNGRTWHKAPPALTADDRCGIFHKYCAVDAPPAAGHYPYDQAAYDALSREGKRLLATHGDLPLLRTRLLIESELSGERRYLVVPGEEQPWQLPGGLGWEEDGVGWDIGARIGSLQVLISEQLGTDVPWASYIDDWVAPDGLTRVYGYLGDDLEAGALAEASWLTADRLTEQLGGSHDICATIQAWRHSDVLRGIGKGMLQSERQFE